MKVIALLFSLFLLYVLYVILVSIFNFFAGIFYFIVPYALAASLIFLALNCIQLSAPENRNYNKFFAIISLTLSSIFFFWMDSYPETKNMAGVCFPCDPQVLKSNAYECSKGFNYIQCTSKRGGEFFGQTYSEAKYFFESRENKGVALKFEKSTTNQSRLPQLILKLETSGWKKNENQREDKKEKWETDYSKIHKCGGADGKKFLCPDKNFTGYYSEIITTGYSFTHADYKYPIHIQLEHDIRNLAFKPTALDLENIGYAVTIGKQRLLYSEMELRETRTPVVNIALPPTPPPSAPSLSASTPDDEACTAAILKLTIAETNFNSSTSPSEKSIQELNDAHAALTKNGCKLKKDAIVEDRK